MIYEKQIDDLRMHFYSQGFIKNIISSSSSYLLKFGVNFFITNEVIKYLGFGSFGVFSFLVSVGAIIGSIGSLGYEPIMARIFKSFDLQNRTYVEIVKNAFTSVFFFGFLISMIFSVLVYFLDRDNFNLALIYSLTFPLISYNVLRLYFEYKLKIRLISRINNIVLAIVSIVKIIVINYDLGLSIFILVAVLESFLYFLSYLWLARRDNIEFDKILKLNFAIIKSLLKESYPFMISSLLIMTYMKLDQVMLRNLLGDSALGSFTSTIRLVELFYFIPVIFQTAYNGHFLQTLDNKIESKKKIFSITATVFFIALLIFLFFTVFSNAILNLVYGKMALQNALLLNLYSLSFIMVSIGTVRNIRINSIGASKFYMIVTFIGVIINISLNLVFIPLFGETGCAVATIVSQFFVSVVSSFFHPILRNDLIFFLVNVFKFRRYRSIFKLT